MSKPIKELGITSLDPLDVPSLVIGAGKSAVDVKQVYKNMKVTGISKLTSCKAEWVVTNVTKLNVDCNDKIVDLMLLQIS